MAQKTTLRRWVGAGAVYEPHWAFVGPKPFAPGHSIDTVVQEGLKRVGLPLQPEADRATLLRRVSLDLIGLPPTPDETAVFLGDPAPNAYEKAVDRLLASPRYGERWARPWLDLARYADTNGYEKDKPRSIWPWRDWVIRALNADMPFDRFTIRQLAGDLLPGATIDDRIATGFHRNTMLNEEGGIDPLEYRYYAQVDRVATTGTTWMGLTVGCAQCHTHKYDPITQREYYRLMAFLDNADEPQIDVPTPAQIHQKSEIEATIAAREKLLPEQWPVDAPLRWVSPRPTAVGLASAASAQIGDDGAVLVQGIVPERDTYTLTLPGPDHPCSVLRLDALTDPSLGALGPGRTPHGNFVLTGISLQVDGVPVKIVRADADFSQEGFPAQDVLKNAPGSGWAIQGSGTWNVDRTARFTLEKPIAGTVWTVTLRQEYGGGHTLGRFRVRLGAPTPDPQNRPLAQRRHDGFEAAYRTWKAARQREALPWTVVRPTRATSAVPHLSVETDGSVFVSGDLTKRDVYALELRNLPRGVTALRLEALPDDRLPSRGPGRIYYEGAPGDFHLSTLRAAEGILTRAASTVGNAAAALDDAPQTGWNIAGTQGQPSVAVFAFEKPLAGESLHLSMVFEHYYAAGLGRFRLAVTTAPLPEGALPAQPVAVDAALARGDDATLQAAFCRVAPELAAAREEIGALRRTVPAAPTTLVFRERPRDNPRTTFVRNRGEYLQPTEPVRPGVPAVLPPVHGADRLAFARWLVSPQNPLTARVVVNRAWASFFGRGIVKTTEDFGYQGDPPTHPELLDGLAVQFVRDGWSLKRLHRRIVLSATYRQSSRATPQALARDPQNRLLSRGPRVRLDAELIRDSALRVSGLLSDKIGGPSVFPPQPANVTTEGAYGALAWTVSAGEDRTRRGLYTFAKRTAPYAMFLTFDGPSGEATCPRREVSNTPLQALTLLNDTVFLEAARALGKTAAHEPGLVGTRIGRLFRRVLTRPPDWDELATLEAFYEKQRQRFASGSLSASALCGTDARPEQAAWTALARVLLNLDEAIVKR
jgi:hypothetical protein